MLLEPVSFDDNIEKKIKSLFATASVIRAVPDSLVVWKLDEEYLDVLCRYMHVLSHERLMNEGFLDAKIDITSSIIGCCGFKMFYPLIKY